MPTRVHEFDWPDRAVIGTIGLPGARTFYLQVRTGKQIVSIALEKQQSAQLAEKIDEILDQLRTFLRGRRQAESYAPGRLVESARPEDVPDHEVAAALAQGFRDGPRLTTREFTRAAKRVLAPDGLYVVNCGDGPDLGTAKREAATIGAEFAHTAIIADPAMLKGRRYGNVIIAGSDAPFGEDPGLARELLGGGVPATCGRTPA